MMSGEVGSGTTSANASTQSTPTPPNIGRRGRRLRKCATPIKSAKKDERGTFPQTGSLSLVLPPGTNSSNSDVITPSSSTATTPAKIENETKATPIRAPLPSPSTLPGTSNLIKKRKRIPYTLVEATKGIRCPTSGCYGLGHVTGLYAMHYAVSGCPIAAQAKKELEKDVIKPPRPPPPHPSFRKKKRRFRSYKKKVPAQNGASKTGVTPPINEPHAIGETETLSKAPTTRLSSSKQTDSNPQSSSVKPPSSAESTSKDSSVKKRKRIPYTLVEAVKGNRCPTPGCGGIGHITGLYSMHYAVSGCPLAHGKTPEECKSRRDELNKSRAQASQTLESESALSPPPRKNPRLMASRNLSATLDSVAIGDPLPPNNTPGFKTLPPNDNKKRFRMPEYYFRPEPKLEGLTSSQDLQLFREAQAKMREQLGTDVEGKHTDYKLSKIIFGCYEIDTWYSSPYPPEYTELSQIYVCEFCLRYYKTVVTYNNHTSCCVQRRPPGREIYRKNTLSVFEVDGENHKEYSQNLCLLAKLFLDHKTLYFNVEPFLFYIVTRYDDTGCHIVGYFSKEKHSPQGFNVSCILVMPPHMRRGYGHLLIDFSYLLTRHQEKVGSPERPLSDLGLLCYRSYWKDKVLSYLTKHNSQSISMKEISLETGISADDLISSLQYYRILKYWKGKHIIIKKKELLEEHSCKVERHKSSDLTIDASCLKWMPTTYPVYP